MGETVMVFSAPAARATVPRTIAKARARAARRFFILCSLLFLILEIVCPPVCQADLLMLEDKPETRF
jgi:hypothetical protein